MQQREDLWESGVQETQEIEILIYEASTFIPNILWILKGGIYCEKKNQLSNYQTSPSYCCIKIKLFVDASLTKARYCTFNTIFFFFNCHITKLFSLVNCHNPLVCIDKHIH